jgi:hypothetical protein
MPTARKLIAGLALALTAISCSEDRSPTAPADQAPSAAPTAPKTQSKALLTNRAASGPLLDASGTQVGTIAGTVTVTHMDVNEAGQLLVTGDFIYTDPNTGLSETQHFVDTPATLKRGIGGPTQPTCEILDLDIGPIHLDVLGLVVDLSAIHLDIVAESGSGNLLGNLLCALAGLLNGPNLGGLLGAIQNLLDQINAILGL